MGLMLTRILAPTQNTHMEKEQPMKRLAQSDTHAIKAGMHFLLLPNKVVHICRW